MHWVACRHAVIATIHETLELEINPPLYDAPNGHDYPLCLHHSLKQDLRMSEAFFFESMDGLAYHDPYRPYDSTHSMIHLSFSNIPFLPLFDWKTTQENPFLSQPAYLARGAVNILEMNSLLVHTPNIPHTKGSDRQRII